ncbi:MAG: hypothetical protein WDA02_04505 [Saccharofermentanales bacterium]
MPALRLASIFGTGMVLQQKTVNKLFGFAAGETRITVEMERFQAAIQEAAESTVQYGLIHVEETRTDRDGYFEFRLPSLKASYDTYRLTVRAGTESVIIEDLLVGEVWLAAGQDNMAQTVRMSDARELLADCINLAAIRIFHMNRDGLSLKVPEYSYSPLGEAQGGGWLRGDQAYHMEGVSAIAFSFARDFYYEANLPIGVIDAACPGTYIHSWLPRDVVESDPLMKNHVREVKLYRDKESWNSPEIEVTRPQKPVSSSLSHAFPRPQTVALLEGRRPDRHGPAPVIIPRAVIRKATVVQDIIPLERIFTPINQPGVMFNHKLAPFVGLSIRGILWMQGESDVDSPEYYLRAFRHFVETCNQMFAPAGDKLIFLISQLPPYLYNGLNSFGLAIFNEMLAHACHTIPAKAGLITVYDLSPAFIEQEYDCAALTPRAKREIGRRMSLIARGLIQGGDLPVSAPQPVSMERIGNKWMIDLSPSAIKGHGLQLGPGHNLLKGFAVCDKSRKFVKAEARILYGVRVLIWHDNIEDPESITYAFSAFNEEANLFGADGIPVLPFRVDLEASVYLPPMPWADCDRLSAFMWREPLLRDSLRAKKKDWPGQGKLWTVTEGRGELSLTEEIQAYSHADILLDYWNADDSPLILDAALSPASAYAPLDFSHYSAIELTLLNPDHQEKKIQLLLEDANGVTFQSAPRTIEDAFKHQVLSWPIDELAADTSRMTRLAFRVSDPGSRGSLIFIRVHFVYIPQEE